ncbi:uncharacterized protein METZ01_LOCUS421857, partial [marine metagenome]
VRAVDEVQPLVEYIMKISHHCFGFVVCLSICLVAIPMDGLGQDQPYRIMIANDDGFDSHGVTMLYDELMAMTNTEVMIVAPDKNYSGAGHWVMLRDPFTVTPIRRNG